MSSGVSEAISRARRLARRVASGSRPAVSMTARGSDISARRIKALGIVPDDVEVLDDGLQQREGRPAAPAMLERRQIGAGDAERRRHVLERDAARGAQLSHALRRTASWRATIAAAAQPDIERAGAAVTMLGLLEADDEGAQLGRAQPMRHHASQHAAPARRTASSVLPLPVTTSTNFVPSRCAPARKRRSAACATSCA